MNSLSERKERFLSRFGYYKHNFHVFACCVRIGIMRGNESTCNASSQKSKRDTYTQKQINIQSRQIFQNLYSHSFSYHRGACAHTTFSFFTVDFCFSPSLYKFTLELFPRFYFNGIRLLSFRSSTPCTHTHTHKPRSTYFACIVNIFQWIIIFLLSR